MLLYSCLCKLARNTWFACKDLFSLPKWTKRANLCYVSLITSAYNNLNFFLVELFAISFCAFVFLYFCMFVFLLFFVCSFSFLLFLWMVVPNKASHFFCCAPANPNQNWVRAYLGGNKHNKYCKYSHSILCSMYYRVIG